MRKKLLCLLILLYGFFELNISAQSFISSDLVVDIGEQSKEERLNDNSIVDYIFFYMFPVRVNQILHLSDYKRDSLVVFQKKPSGWNPVLLSNFFHNFEVTAVQNGNKIEIPHIFNGDSLVIFPISKNCDIMINYEYQSDYFAKGINPESGIICYFQPQLYDWHSWFFTSPEIQLSQVTFIVPTQEAYFFATNTSYVYGNTFKTNIEKIKNNDISFYLLNKTYYKTHSFTAYSAKINLFFNSGVHIDSTNVVRNGAERILYRFYPKHEIEEGSMHLISEKLSNSLQKIEKIFNSTDSVEINIADAYLTLEDDEDNKFVWGNTTSLSDNSCLILIDESMWKTHDLIHEVIHVFNKLSPSKEDKAHFFFNESLVEYLAVYLGYNTANERDSVFKEKYGQYNKTEKSDSDVTSVFDIKTNEYRMDGSIGGTAPVVYSKTPYKIHLFAKIIGESKFVSLLSEFYNNVRKKGVYNFTDFEKIMKDNGVTENQWDDFIKDL